MDQEAPMPATDRDLVDRCLDGHPDDFRHLVGRYQGPVLAHLRGRLRLQAQVEEAAQEAFVRAFFNLRRLREPDSFFSWVLGIANHVAQEMIRRERAELRWADEQLSGQQAAPARPAGVLLDDALERAVAGLTDPLREVILLRFYAGRSCSQVAQMLGLPIGTVTKRLSRAYAEIRGRLAADRHKK
jgi:RNA polymerase sigma-70 factor, ECF subfamily